MEPVQVLAQVTEQVKECQKCQLHFSRKNSVPGEGPATAVVLLIGEGPGFHENEQGRPFVGQAGKLLNELLQSAGLERTAVFITNVVKCRPPGNRDPLPEELSACAEYLERQIEALQPQVVVTLGRFSMARFLPNAKISEAHGKPFSVQGRLIVPMYHPAAALHQPSLRPMLEQDFARLPEWMQQKRAAAAQSPAEAAHRPSFAAAQPQLEAAQPQLDVFEAAVEQPGEPSSPSSDEVPTQLSLF